MEFEVVFMCEANNGISCNGAVPWSSTPEHYKFIKYHTKMECILQSVDYNDLIVPNFIKCYRPYQLIIDDFMINRFTEEDVNVYGLTHDITTLSPMKNIKYINNFNSLPIGNYLMLLHDPQFIKMALESQYTTRVTAYRLNTYYNCSTSIDPTTFGFTVTNTVIHKLYDLITFKPLYNEEEFKYIDLCKKLLNAPIYSNRTGVSTHGLFVETLKFNLMRDSARVLPLLTTKSVPWKTVTRELYWFLMGNTTTEYLDKYNVKIWSGNSTREFLDSRGLDYPIGTLGPIYGFQWRHWGADWKSENPQGIDQIQNVIHTIKTNPRDRRMIVSAWNVEDISKMALPPCHYTFQFHVSEIEESPGVVKHRLNCAVTMRSADIALGVPFNIASYAMLTHIISFIVGMDPGILSITMVDCHLYTTHVEGVTQMINRSIKPFPTLSFGITNDSTIDTIDKFITAVSIDSIQVINYNPHPFIRLEMAV